VSEPSPQGQAPGPRANGGAAGTAAAGLGLLLLKLKGGVGALKLFKLASLGKMLPTLLSMAAMVWVEAQRAGLAFGLGFVLLILLHELGHGYAIKRAGLSAGWPVFIPFVGAMISMRGQIPSASVEADIAYAGPIAGTAASLVCAGLGLWLDSRLLLSLAYVGFFLNLFNMVPLSPLDGGRVAQAFSKRGWLIGVALLVAMLFVMPSFQLALIAGLGLMQAFRPRQHAELPPVEQRAWMVRYFGLCFFLGAALWLSSRVLHVHMA
jgi:Zn-dependent protease